MGFYIKKSITIGWLRINFSKSGIGFSFGPKGAKFAVGPKGTQVHAGRNGIYYRKSISKDKILSKIK
jgi:hypothetical protein